MRLKTVSLLEPHQLLALSELVILLIVDKMCLFIYLYRTRVDVRNIQDVITVWWPDRKQKAALPRNTLILVRLEYTEWDTSFLSQLVISELCLFRV